MRNVKDADWEEKQAKSIRSLDFADTKVISRVLGAYGKRFLEA